MIYLKLDDLLYVAERTLSGAVAIRDIGLLQSALARSRATAFGQNAYSSLDDKAAALLHSLTRNHALVDGNKRLALAATIAFYGLNGRRLTLSNDEAYDLVMDVAAGKTDEVGDIATRLSRATHSEVVKGLWDAPAGPENAQAGPDIAATLAGPTRLRPRRGSLRRGCCE